MSLLWYFTHLGGFAVAGETWIQVTRTPASCQLTSAGRYGGEVRFVRNGEETIEHRRHVRDRPAIIIIGWSSTAPQIIAVKLTVEESHYPLLV